MAFHWAVPVGWGDVDVGVSLSLVGVPLREAVALARRAEANGAPLITVGEVAYDSFAVATAIALATERVPLMTGVTTWTRPPVTTATGALTVADAAGPGRFTLGLGTMPAHWNRDQYGIDPSRPIARMREYVAAVRAAMEAHSGRTCEFDGEFFTITGYRRPAPAGNGRATPSVPAGATGQATVPIGLAVTRPRMARLCGEIADVAYINVIHTTPWVKEKLVPAISTSGRRVTRGIMVRAAIGDDHERCLEELRTSLSLYLTTEYFYEVAAHAGFDLKPGCALTDVPRELVAQMGVYGTPAEIAGRLRRYVGLVDWVVLAPPAGVELRAARDQLETIIDTPWASLMAESAAVADGASGAGAAA